MCWQLDAEQVSSVHPSRSSHSNAKVQQLATRVVWHRLVPVSQVLLAQVSSVEQSAAVAQQALMGLKTQAWLTHWLLVQSCESSQSEPVLQQPATGVKLQRPALQVSAVHTSWSSQSGLVRQQLPAQSVTHRPAGRQVSVVQKSGHVVFLAPTQRTWRPNIEAHAQTTK